MIFKDLEIATGSVYLNIVSGEEVQTATLDTDKAKAQYGDLEVESYEVMTPATEQEETTDKKKKKQKKDGLTNVILKA